MTCDTTVWAPLVYSIVQSSVVGTNPICLIGTCGFSQAFTSMQLVGVLAPRAPLGAYNTESKEVTGGVCT